MMKQIKLMMVLGVLGLLTSCEEARGYDDYDAGVTPTLAMNGEWVLNITDESTGDVLAEHIPHWTYDTAENDGRMYIDDQQEGYYIKGKVNVNLNDLTF